MAALLVALLIGSLLNVFFSGKLRISQDELPAALPEGRNTDLVRELRDDMNRLKSTNTDERGFPRETDLRLKANEVPVDEAGILRSLFHEYANGMMEQQNTYVRKLTALGAPTMISPARIARDKDFTQSREKIHQYRKLTEEFQKDGRTYLTGFAKWFDRMKLPPARREAIKAGWEKGMAEALPLHEKVWEQENQGVHLLEQMINHLEASSEAWVEENNKFIFEKEVPMKEYQKIMRQIFACIEEQVKVREDAAKRSEKRLDMIERSLRR